MTHEESTIIGFVAEHWGKISTGAAVIFGFVYRTGGEHQKYQTLRRRVSDIECECDERMSVISTMNSNLCRIMGHLGIQPVEQPYHRRKEDQDEHDKL